MVLDDDTQKVLYEHRRKRGAVKPALTQTLIFIENFDPRVKALSLIDLGKKSSLKSIENLMTFKLKENCSTLKSLRRKKGKGKNLKKIFLCTFTNSRNHK